jgi:hypothetical protein
MNPKLIQMLETIEDLRAYLSERVDCEYFTDRAQGVWNQEAKLLMGLEHIVGELKVALIKQDAQR